jgi:DNA-binding beta-propeller fold protein YncE
MTERWADPDLYPNAGSGNGAGLSRRRLLAGGAAAGAVAAAGCAGGSSGTDDGGGDAGSEPTVFVFNTGDGTASVLDPAADEVVETRSIGMTASFPSNQYSPGLTDAPEDPLWLNVDRGIRGLAVGSLSGVVDVETGSGANWLEQTPDGRHLVVSAREPAHVQFRIDADPGSETFGEVTGEIDRTPEGGRGDNEGPGPCDVTIHPDGEYAYVPDLFGDTLTVLDVAAFEIETQVDVAPVGDDPAAPWMGTVAPDGETLLVEHNEGDRGTESIWDLSDPANPTERVRLTGEDGLGSGPLTSEIGPDSETGYVFTPDSADVTVLDLAAGTVVRRIDLGGSAFVGTWDPAQETLYAPVQTSDEVAAIDHAAGEVTTRIDVGPRPYGATAATVRPDPDGASNAVTTLSRLAFAAGTSGTTYCIGNCGCDHQL